MKDSFVGRIKEVNDPCAQEIYACCKAVMHRRKKVQADDEKKGQRNEPELVYFCESIHRNDYKAKQSSDFRSIWHSDSPLVLTGSFPNEELIIASNFLPVNTTFPSRLKVYPYIKEFRKCEKVRCLFQQS